MAQGRETGWWDRAKRPSAEQSVSPDRGFDYRPMSHQQRCLMPVQNLMLGMRKSLFLLGSFSIGYNLAMAIHELGHALAMWATGGSVARIRLNPFSWSYTYYGSSPACPVLTALTSTDGALARLKILEGGVGPYLIAMLVYQIWRNPREIVLWATYVVAGIFLLAGVAVGSIFVERRWPFRQRHTTIEPTWRAAVISLVAAAILFAAEFLAFGG